MKTAVEEVQSVRYMLRCLGVKINHASLVCGDNKGVIPLITVRRFIVQLHKDLCLTGISDLTLAIQILLLRFNCISILHCKLHLSLINELSVSMMFYKIISIVVLKPSNIEILL